MLTLKVDKRTNDAAKALRRSGSVPAVVYGPHYESTPVVLEMVAFEKVLRDAGEATIVSLTGLGEPLPTLIHEVDFDPITNRPSHVDFYAVAKGEKVEVSIPLAFVGTSAAVESGANLVKVLHELEIKADPMNLPHTIEVDISALATFADRIHAKDLALPSGVELITAPGEVVALAQEVVEDKKEAPAAADLSSIEVEKKGKEEAAGGAAPTA